MILLASERQRPERHRISTATVFKSGSPFSPRTRICRMIASTPSAPSFPLQGTLPRSLTAFFFSARHTPILYPPPTGSLSVPIGPTAPPFRKPSSLVLTVSSEARPNQDYDLIASVWRAVWKFDPPLAPCPQPQKSAPLTSLRCPFTLYPKLPTEVRYHLASRYTACLGDLFALKRG